MRISDWSSDVCSSDLASVQICSRPRPAGQGCRIKRDQIDRPAAELCRLIGVKQNSRTFATSVMQRGKDAELGLAVILRLPPIHEVNKLLRLTTDHYRPPARCDSHQAMTKQSCEQSHP